MEKDLFNINNFNIIQDEENYYFFRALNMADNSDIEQKITTSENGKIEKIRTDRERYEGETRYSEDEKISLEEMYDHIKIHYRKDTNCISLTSNANIAANYGRGSYKDKYVMIKIPKSEFGEQTVEAGQYMLQELYSRIEHSIEQLPEDLKNKVLDIFTNIDNITDSKELKEMIAKKYTAKSEDVDVNKAHPRNGIVYNSPKARISSYQSLDEKQLLEVNKVYAKLAILENEHILEHVIPHSSNSKLRETIGNAFSSAEVIHYGEIKQENIVEIPKEVVDIFALVQQVNDIDKNKVEELKQALIIAIQSGKKIPQIPEIDLQVKDNIGVEEMYELTGGTIEYGKANSIAKNIFYLSKSRQNAIALSSALSEILGNDSRFEDIIKYIRENGFRVEPEIITRQSGKGVKLSESVNINLVKQEQRLIDEIKKLSPEELETVLQNGGLANVQNVISNTYGNTNKKIDKSRYYAEAIISQYDWKKIGIEEFKTEERNELIKKLQDRNCIEIYEKLRQSGIDEKQIPTVLLNIATREGLYNQYVKGNLEELLNTRQDVLQNNINIELVERFLGYYDVENTGIKLKDYQQRAYDNVDKIFEDHKFAQVILPTGAGKSFVALAQMKKYAEEHPNEKMIYLAPQDEILNQIKSYIVKNVHGKRGTVEKSEDKIIAEVFPNITFETYSGLLAKRGQGIIKDQYGMIVLDELHRTGAKEWEGKIDKLLENQSEDVKVLGITATPVRDVDGRDMAEETAKKLGYTDEEVKQRKHLASNMTLKNAIRMGYVVNPKIVYCKYDLISSGKMDELRAKIDDIEDETKRAEELQKYNEFRQKLNNEIDGEIGEEGRKKLEDEARKNLDSGIGKEEILRQNVKKGGKYIVFIPITDQGDIEDEDGNRIGTKTGEDKILGYQEYLNKVFEGTDITPQLHSLLGSYSKERNKEELKNFESDNSNETKFMVVMNKANEGLHIDGGVDGIIWFRALDENSRILYLQQLGRAIYALDEDNPLPDDKRPVVIDLANNSLTVKMEREFENIEPIDDLEALTIVTEWINEHDGMLPERTSSNKQEQHYYAILRRIQNKYSKYLDGFENFEDLTEEDKSIIGKINNLATKIDLWDMEIPPIPKLKGSKEEFTPFAIEGILKDFVEIEERIERQGKSTPFEKVMKFARKNGRIPRASNKKSIEQTEEEKEENRLYEKWKRTAEKKKVDSYTEIELEDISEKDQELVKLVRSYGYGLTKFEEVMKFAEENGRIPRPVKKNKKTEEEKEENRLYKKWIKSSEKKIVDSYTGMELEQIPEEDRELVMLVRSYGYGLESGLTPFEEVMKFAKENGRIPKKIKNAKTEEEKEENRLYIHWNRTVERNIVNSYIGKELEEIPEEDRELVKTIRNYGYGLRSKLIPFEEVMKFAKKNGRIPKNTKNAKTEEEKEENRLYKKWIKSSEKKIVDSYTGMELEQIQEEDRELVKTIRNYGYGLGSELTPFEDVMKFARENGRIPRASNKESIEQTEEEKKENRLYEKWRSSSEKKIVNDYIGKKLEQIPEEDRELVKLVRSYGYGLTKLEEVMKFAEENGRIPKGIQNAKTEEEKEERNLYTTKWLGSITKKKVDSYIGKELEEIPEEDRKLVKKVRSYGYGLSKFQEVMEFAKEYGRIPRNVRNAKTEEEKKENGLYYSNWQKSDEKKKVDSYIGKELEKIPEEDRELVKRIRSYGYGLGNGLTSFEEVMEFAKKNGRIPKATKKKIKTEEEKEENRLYTNWYRTAEKKIVDSYTGKELKQIPEEDRELVKTVRSYGYGLGSGLTPFEEVMKFAKENGRIPIGIHKQTKTEEEIKEKRLSQKWRRSDEKKIVDSYIGKKLEQIPEEDRELVKTIRGYGYGVTPFQEVMKFAEENGRIPIQRIEGSLYQKWFKSDEKKLVDSYTGMELEQIPEEDRELVKKVRSYGYFGNKSKLNESKNQRDSAKLKNTQTKKLEEQVSEQLKKRGNENEK